MKARVSQLHKTAAEWLKYSDWIPEAGELVVYDPDENFKYSRVKVGDGKTKLSLLSFSIDSAIAAYIKKHRYEEIIDGGRITDYKK